MHQDWLAFLTAQHAVIQENGLVSFSEQKPRSPLKLSPLTHLGVLSVSGRDAATLLQGQLTCNVNDLTATQGSLAAMCNAKGRVIATLLVVVKAEEFLLILPLCLLGIVSAKLKMYVLRSQVQIKDNSAELCLLGVMSEGKPLKRLFAAERAGDDLFINFAADASRTLIVAEFAQAMSHWLNLTRQQGYVKSDTTTWLLADLLSGIPWLDAKTSEHYIPQMLNLDKLGGISFTKGCYTGQEVVARTHYLGKVKREMLLAECESGTIPEANSPVINGEGQVAGHVLHGQRDQDKIKLLVIMQMTDIDHHGLKLSDYNQSIIQLLPFNS